MCLLDAAGVGISHVLGVGGRDLSPEVSGRSALAALAALDADPATELIVVVSKPPAPRVADLIREAARRLDTPVECAFPGPDDDLTRATERVLRRLGGDLPETWLWGSSGARPLARPGPVRGLFSGGTLRDEAEAVLRSELGEDPAARGHTLVDYGADEYTRGRPHPMIDPTVRTAAIREQAETLTGGVLLIDVVLGHGADPDPGAVLAPLLREVLDGHEDLRAVVTLCGSAADPQDSGRQAALLLDAGAAAVHLSNAQAARYAAELAGGTGG
jgi:FdrA protein